MAGVGAVALLVSGAFAQGLAPRQDVTFEVVQTTTFGTSVYVVGDLPELGSDSTAAAVKLSPGAYPTWRATVSLPSGRTVRYRYIARADGPGQQNAAPVWSSPVSTLVVPDQARAAGGKAVWVTTSLVRPRIWWRPASPTSGGAFVSKPMEEYGPAAAGRAGETRWLAWGLHAGGEALDFYFEGEGGAGRDPAAGWYSTNLDGVFVQDGQLYTYIPAASVAGARRDYSASGVPTLFSPQLGQTRGYRVFLPRGYDQHPWRRYPVLYMHDGQNVFESGPFGSWNAAGTLAGLQASGRMREIIVVGLDNVGGTRIADYSPPGENSGRGQQYAQYIVGTVKPVIDAQYRTLAGAAETGTLGSSMGGVISAYLAYDWPGSFGRAGWMSTAWWTVPGYTAYVKGQPARAGLRLYVDCGDTGDSSSDGYWDTLGVRDALVGGLPRKYALEGAVRFTVGFGHAHNEAAWAARLPGALTFLYPAQGEPSELLREVFSASWDGNGDGRMDVEDLYAQAAAGRDLNYDGVVDGVDADGVEQFVRRGEARGMAGR